jgi:hypothetical protein
VLAKLYRVAAGLLLAATTCASAGETPPMRFVLPSVTPGAQAQADYFPQLLRLALEKTEGPFTIEFYQH